MGGKLNATSERELCLPRVTSRAASRSGKCMKRAQRSRRVWRGSLNFGLIVILHPRVPAELNDRTRFAKWSHLDINFLQKPYKSQISRCFLLQMVPCCDKRVGKRPVAWSSGRWSTLITALDPSSSASPLLGAGAPMSQHGTRDVAQSPLLRTSTSLS